MQRTIVSRLINLPLTSDCPQDGQIASQPRSCSRRRCAWKSLHLHTTLDCHGLSSPACPSAYALRMQLLVLHVLHTSRLKESRPNICPSPVPDSALSSSSHSAMQSVGFALVHSLNAPMDKLHALICCRLTTLLGVVLVMDVVARALRLLPYQNVPPPKLSSDFLTATPFHVGSARREAWGPT